MAGLNAALPRCLVAGGCAALALRVRRLILAVCGRAKAAFEPWLGRQVEPPRCFGDVSWHAPAVYDGASSSWWKEGGKEKGFGVCVRGVPVGPMGRTDKTVRCARASYVDSELAQVTAAPAVTTPQNDETTTTTTTTTATATTTGRGSGVCACHKEKGFALLGLSSSGEWRVCLSQGEGVCVVGVVVVGGVCCACVK